MATEGYIISPPKKRWCHGIRWKREWHSLKYLVEPPSQTIVWPTTPNITPTQHKSVGYRVTPNFHPLIWVQSNQSMKNSPLSKVTGKGIPLNPLGLARLGIAIPPPPPGAPPGAPGGTAKGVELLMGAASRWSQLRRKKFMEVVTISKGWRYFDGKQSCTSLRLVNWSHYVLRPARFLASTVSCEFLSWTYEENPSHHPHIRNCFFNWKIKLNEPPPMEQGQ